MNDQRPTALPLTGTFLDEITHDIPSQNWGREEWDREFGLYRRIGIDTVILIRAGYRDRCVFPARSVPDLLPVYEDLARMFLDLAHGHGIRLFFGLFDSGVHWVRGDWREEVELNLRFIEEVAERYGAHPAFQGWYLCHETGRREPYTEELYNRLGHACKAAVNRPVLISPYPQGAKQPGGAPLTLEQSFAQWHDIFEQTRGAFDICAFQDGQVHYRELPEFQQGISELGRRHGVTVWANVETFDRDMPIKFPPADWRNLRFKLESASQRAEKLITFEFAHFLSPHSCYPAAHHLFRRYAEHFGLRGDEQASR